MKLIIAGGRNYRLNDKEYRLLDKFTGLVSEVITGGATGIDACGEQWANWHSIPIRVFLPNWKKYGKGAGPRRNAVMAMHADAVVLFPGGRGTESMFQEAKKRNLKIYDWR